MHTRSRKAQSNPFLMTTDFYTIMFLVMVVIASAPPTNQDLLKTQAGQGINKNVVSITLTLNEKGDLNTDQNKPVQPAQLRLLFQDARAQNIILRVPKNINMHTYINSVSILKTQIPKANVSYQYQ